MQFQFWSADDDAATGIIHALTQKILSETALLAFNMTAKERSLRFCPVEAVTSLPWRMELSINASAASWSMRFSLRVITSGAPISKSFFRRLLRLITRRYKSFKSEAAKRPPSSCTIGRRSGGITGKLEIIIHSGRIPALIMDFTNFNLLISLRL